MAALRAAVLSILAALMLALAPAAGAIVDGQPDTTRNYVVFVQQTVVYAHPSFPAPGVRPVNSSCSGTLLAARVVVTAAHCLIVQRPPSVPADATVVAVMRGVRYGPNALASPLIPASRVVAQPGFSFGGDGLPHFASNDLAVMELAADLPPPYARLPQPGATETIAPTDPLAVVGYGISEMHGNKPNPLSFGLRRSGDASLLRNAAVEEDLLHFRGDACLGDSGGPLLQGNVVLGVVAFAPSACKSTNYATRLDTADSLAFVGSFLAG